jgi:oxygen-independent coproporphyrinogen-3 oxidase
LQEIQHSDIANYSVDLIFGMEKQNLEKIIQGIEKIITYQPTHFSIYALSVEENTALQSLIKKGKRQILTEDRQEKMYKNISNYLQEKGFFHYEISSYALPGKESKHNSAYWFGESYLGFGPSAHSFHNNARYWNLSDLTKYIEHPLQKEKEELTEKSMFNERIMLGLRTAKGLNLDELKLYNSTFYKLFEKELTKIISQGYLVKEGNTARIPYYNWFSSDYIISSLFIA